MITLTGGDVVMTGLEKNTVDQELKARAARIFALGEELAEAEHRFTAQQKRQVALIEKFDDLQDSLFLERTAHDNRIKLYWDLRDREQENTINAVWYYVEQLGTKYYHLDMEWPDRSATQKDNGHTEAKGYTEVDGVVTGMLVADTPYDEEIALHNQPTYAGGSA